jgi:ribosomal protein L37AE/L43A
MGKIADIIYEELDYMYCDNCRYQKNSEDKYGMDHCDDCHRKYNGWGVSKETAEAIEKRYLKEMK